MHYPLKLTTYINWILDTNESDPVIQSAVFLAELVICISDIVLVKIVAESLDRNANTFLVAS